MNLKRRDTSSQEFSKDFDPIPDSTPSPKPFDNASNNPTIDDNEDSSDGLMQVKGVTITFDESDFAGQRERLQEEFGLSDDETDIIWGGVHSLVESMAEEKGKDWSEEVIEGVTNLITSMLIQEEKQKRPV
jgi:hypothetical protein